MSICKCRQPIGELEGFYLSDGNTLETRYPASIEANFAKQNNGLTPALHLSRESAGTAVNAVRNKILEWSLRLESEGILGENLMFSSKEKEIAAEKRDTLIFHIGSMVNSQIQQGNVGSTLAATINMPLDKIHEIFNLIKENEARFGLSPDNAAELSRKIEDLKIHLEESNPQQGILASTLKSIKTILEGTTGNLLASGILYEMGKVLG